MCSKIKNMNKAFIVVGTGYGDEGKGLTTSYLCSKFENESNIVIRFSGGQQAGHTVIENGIRHVHSNFGSGTLFNVPTYFTEHCTFYPNTIHREETVLSFKGIKPILYIHPFAKMTTPADVAYNRIRETKLGHGSCGLGIGATMKRNDTTGFKLHAIDTTYPELFFQKVDNITNYYKSIIDESDLKEFNSIVESEMSLFKEVYDKTFGIVKYDFLTSFDNLIFEGSQGILLDMDHGVFPNVTYANTTSKNAIEVCNKLKIKTIDIFYITRCYQTRHGNGWMSNREDVKLINNESETNVFNQWQGNFKIGEVDYTLIEYAINVDKSYHIDFRGEVLINIVVTCLDQRPEFKFDYTKIESGFDGYFESFSPESRKLVNKLNNVLV